MDLFLIEFTRNLIEDYFKETTFESLEFEESMMEILTRDGQYDLALYCLQQGFILSGQIKEIILKTGHLELYQYLFSTPDFQGWFDLSKDLKNNQSSATKSMNANILIKYPILTGHYEPVEYLFNLLGCHLFYKPWQEVGEVIPLENIKDALISYAKILYPTRSTTNLHRQQIIALKIFADWIKFGRIDVLNQVKSHFKLTITLNILYKIIKYKQLELLKWAFQFPETQFRDSQLSFIHQYLGYSKRLTSFLSNPNRNWDTFPGFNK